jgi:hypothetical protein
LLPCTIMMNNMEFKREGRENQDIDLRGSSMCLRPQECGYIQYIIEGYIITYL